MKLSELFKEALLEAKKKKPSAGLSKKEKSAVVKKAIAGKDIGKKGKGFEKVVAKAKKSGADDPEAVAAAAMWKNIKRVKEDLQRINPSSEEEKRKYKKDAEDILKKFNGNIDKAIDHIDQEQNKLSDKDPNYESKFHNLLGVWGTLNDMKKSSNIKEEERPDHEVAMAKNSLMSIMKSAQELMRKMGDEERNIAGWVQDHITNAENYLDQAAQGFHELAHDEDDEEYEEMGMIEPVDEKKLTKAEKAKKEEIIKAMAKKGGGKEKMKAKDYAIATAQAIKSAE